MNKVLNADVVAWATPIYYYEMCGQMKVLIDRMNPMFSKDYKLLGLIALMDNQYRIKSNRESGDGRYKRSFCAGWFLYHRGCETG